MRANALKPRLDARSAPRGRACGRVVKPRRTAIATRSSGRREREDAGDASVEFGVAVAVVAAIASSVVDVDGAEAYEAAVRVRGGGVDALSAGEDAGRGTRGRVGRVGETRGAVGRAVGVWKEGDRAFAVGWGGDARGRAWTDG